MAFPNGLLEILNGDILWRSAVHSNFSNLDARRILSGTFSARPAAANVGRYYFATDRRALYYDTGAVWLWIAGEEYFTVNTTDATLTTLVTIPIAASETYLIGSNVTARRTGGAAGTADDGGAFVRRSAYTTKAGTVTQLGSVSDDFTEKDQAAWDVQLNISGSNLLLQVVGAVNNNITWEAWINVRS